MPAWIHDRADHLRKKNPEMPEGQAWAIATQQAYAAGKAPKKFGTTEGRKDAKQKYDGPKSEYVKTPDPKTKSSSIDVALIMGFSDELRKIAAATFTATPTTGSVDVAKMVSKGKSSLTTLPKQISKPSPPATPATSIDHLGPNRTSQPPPITASGE